MIAKGKNTKWEFGCTKEKISRQILEIILLCVYKTLPLERNH